MSSVALSLENAVVPAGLGVYKAVENAGIQRHTCGNRRLAKEYWRARIVSPPACHACRNGDLCRAVSRIRRDVWNMIVNHPHRWRLWSDA